MPNQDLEYLKNEVDDWPGVVSAWKNTYLMRQQIFKNKTIYDILQLFPCLTQPLVVVVYTMMMSHDEGSFMKY